MQAEYVSHGIRLRTSPTRSYRRFSLVWRSIVILFAAIALGFELSIVSSVFDPRFPASHPFMSTLPTGGLCGHILWNIVAIATSAFVKPYLHTVGDLIALVSLIIMGYVGFSYDDMHYLRNGVWRRYETPGFLNLEIAAGILMIVVAILQGVLVFVTALTRARLVSQPEIYHYGAEEPIREDELAYFERDERRMSISKSSLNSIAKTKLDRE